MPENNNLKLCLRNNLLVKRKELDITQERMAEKLDLSTRAYQKLEYGENFCSAETLINLVNNVDIDKEQLFSEFGKALHNTNDTQR